MQTKNQPHYLDFTRKEKNGIIFSLCLILFLVFLPFLYDYFFSPPITDQKKIQEELNALEGQLLEYPGHSSTSVNSTQSTKNSFGQFNHADETVLHHLSSFDPNTLSAEGWAQMGLQRKTINTIQHYLSKGGVFRKPEDIKKIWGISDHLAMQLLPYIKINKQSADQNNFPQHKFTERKKVALSIIDINISDSAEIESLPGIGPTLARRIIKYRDRLGGFYSIDQVAETYGLPDSTFQKIKSRIKQTPFPLKKINVNLATLEEFKSHPYINYRLANAMVAYRKQHGKFLSVEDIKKILLIDEETFNKIVNYLVVS